MRVMSGGVTQDQDNYKNSYVFQLSNEVLDFHNIFSYASCFQLHMKIFNACQTHFSMRVNRAYMMHRNLTSFKSSNH
jgi:hypothetical protein